MRHGVHFATRHPHELAHVAPLRQRLQDVKAGDETVASVVVHTDTRRPVRDAWNVQVFHGLGDPAHTLNPIFLQRHRWPRFRRALNRLLYKLHLPAPLLRPPRRIAPRAGLYNQVNAYGPLHHDRLQAMLRDAEVTKFGHVALNQVPRIPPNPNGPLLWLPTWDQRAISGGRQRSSLAAFAHEVALVSRHVPVRVKYHPMTLIQGQDVAARAELEKEAGITILPDDADPYGMMRGVRGVLSDTSSLGLEAYCLGLPVALARPPGYDYTNLEAELAERVPVMSAGKPDLLAWAEAPDIRSDRAWQDDLLYPPSPKRNDDFAKDLRSRMGHR